MINTPDPVTVTTAGTFIFRNSDDRASRPGTFLLRNMSGTTVYIGGGYTGADNQEVILVTSANGFPVEQDEVLSLDLIAGESVYGITASGTATVRMIRTGG